VRVGWTGGPGNLKYLQAIGPALLQVQREFPQVQFDVYCGKAPRFAEPLHVNHIRYRGCDEPEVIREFDIGLAPLPDNEFAGGKSPIKCLQYMASGVAPIVSPIGATRSMFVDRHTALFARTTEEWAAAIKRLVTDTKLRHHLSENARMEFEKKYSLTSQVPLLADVLHKL
jgi:glycosyltransferase involved in cell wall biosynthesis